MILTVSRKSLLTEDNLLIKATEYSRFFNKYAVAEVERVTLISAILVALKDPSFSRNYALCLSNRALIDALLEACARVLEAGKMDPEKIKIIIHEYAKFRHNTALSAEKYYNPKTQEEEESSILKDFIASIKEHLTPYMPTSTFDVLGKCYTQFTRHTEKKTGLVLTPTHITELFCAIAELEADDTVFDPCCGTGGFLVSAMSYMQKKAGQRDSIKPHQFLGIEKRSDMFAVGASNMLLRGGSHLLYGNCFDKAHKEQIVSQKPTVGLLNPPYQGNAHEQLAFIENTLECLQEGGRCVAICQMSVTVSEKPEVIAARKKLLEKHTLEASFSMPTDLFFPLKVETNILVFKAHTPHPEGKKTFLGYFKEDGFEKTQNYGRIDKSDRWEAIKKAWLKAYRQRATVPGLSVMQSVSAGDEWCAEAHMKADYTRLSEDSFTRELHELTSHLFSTGVLKEASDRPLYQVTAYLSERPWRWFNILEHFNISTGKRLLKEQKAHGEGTTALVSSATRNNGVQAFVNAVPKHQNAITMGKVEMPVYYHPYGFVTSSDVIVMEPKERMSSYIAMFLVTVLKLERFKWNFGRQMRLSSTGNIQYQLPVRGIKPDWVFMDYYIKTLAYSSNLAALEGSSDLQLVKSFEAIPLALAS